MLLVDGIARTLDYYRDALGFDVEPYEEGPRTYGYAQRDACHLHFACYAGARPRPNSEAVPPDLFDVYVWVDDVEALHEELVGRGADVIQPPTDQGYGQRDIRVRDPHGYVLAFGQPL